MRETPITTVEEFNEFVARLYDGKVFDRVFAVGLARKDSRGDYLDTWYPLVNWRINKGTFAAIADYYGLDPFEKESYHLMLSAVEIKSILLRYFLPFEFDGGFHANIDVLKQLRQALDTPCDHPREVVLTVLSPEALTQPVTSVPDAYLRLHALSYRFVKPNEIRVDNMFSVLQNVIRTSKGVMSYNDFQSQRMEMAIKGEHLQVYSQDKLPFMMNYVVLPDVRIADSARVRLGAYIGSGTTVMQEGFVNFAAGTEGPGMIEGRISHKVFVGAGSDLGGSCSTMGTLSGGNKRIISIGEKCLIGANAGVGIALGDNCVVESGLYVTAGSRVSLVDDKRADTDVKAVDLWGKSNLLFRRNSLDGNIEVLSNDKEFSLNEILHDNKA